MKKATAAKVFSALMALGYFAMLYFGLTGKCEFLQMHNSSLRYGGYLWFYVGICCYLLCLLGIYLYTPKWMKKLEKKTVKYIYLLPAIVLILIHSIMIIAR